MANSTGLIIGIPKLAEYLKCSVPTVYKYIKLGLPGERVDGQWHFHIENIERFWKDTTNKKQDPAIINSLEMHL